MFWEAERTQDLAQAWLEAARVTGSSVVRPSEERILGRRNV